MAAAHVELPSVASKKLILVSGHKDIQRGPMTTNGSLTIEKKATAWEVLLYLGMALRVDESMAALAAFVPPIVAVLPPDDGGVSHWMFVEREKDRSSLVVLYQQLQQRSAALEGYSEVMDARIWGVCLIDVTATLHKPCVADIKIGFVRHSPHTPAEKLQRIMEKRLLQPYALRLCGAHHCFHRTTAGDPCFVEECCEKDMGYTMETEDSYLHCLYAFFSSTVSMREVSSVFTCTDTGRVALRLRACLEQVEKLFAFFSSSLGQELLDRFAFVSTSLLIVYNFIECGGEGLGSGDDYGVHVYLIDFSRSSYRKLNFSEEKVGFLHGLESMIRFLSLSKENDLSMP